MKCTKGEKELDFLKPLLVGLVPRSLYKYIRKRKYIVSKM